MRSPLFSITALAVAAFLLASCSRDPSPAAASPSSASAPGSPYPKPGRPANPLTFAGQTLTAPPGFTIEVVAHPPMVNRPISIAFDERGRLYVTDSSGLSDKADKQLEQKPHRIVRLEDTNGDGRFDKSTVYADKVMFPQGALFYEGSLYVAAPPHIWKFTDADDDGVAERRDIWYDGKTLTGCGNDLHGPYLGPDGWFYWTKGAFAEQRHTLGNGKPFVTRAAHIFRARPDGTGLEPVLTGGMDNPVGLTFTAAGDCMLSGTFFEVGTPGKRDGLIHAIYGGVYGKDQPAIEGHVRTGDLMPIMTHMGAAAPAGLTTYRSIEFGTEYTDDLFASYFNLRKVVRHKLNPTVVGFTTTDTDFLTSDSPDFRPTDVLEDADGSLLVVDTGGWYKICCPTSQLAKPDVLGAIYRIRKKDARPLDDPRGLKFPWSTMTPTDLVARLADRRLYVRERATHALGRMGAAAVPALRKELADGYPVPSRHAVRALTRIEGAEARAAVRSVIGSQDETLAQLAIQSAGLWRDVEACDALGARVKTQSDVARAAAEALGRMDDDLAVNRLMFAIRMLPEFKVTASGTPAHPSDRMLDHSLIYALIELNRPARLDLFAGLDNLPNVARAALVALDQLRSPSLTAEKVILKLDAHSPMLRNTARWIVSHRPDWGEPLAAYYQLKLQRLHPGHAAELQAQLAPLASSPAIQNLLLNLATTASSPEPTRLFALRTMSAASLKAAPAPWLDGLARLLSSREPAILPAVVATARTVSLPKGGHAGLAAALAELGRDQAQPPALRIEALAAATPAALGPIEPPLFDLLRTHLDRTERPPLRAAAATVLAKASLTGAQQLALARALTQVGMMDAPKLLPAFERQPTEELGRQLIAGLRESPGLVGVRPALLKTLFAKYPASIQPAAQELIASLDPDATRQQKRLDELAAGLAGGDIRRGQVIFNSEKAACTLCHTVGYAGGRLGPDLTAIGRIRSERELLEGVVFPSATLVRGYEPVVIKLHGGAEHTGIVRKDTAEELVLATGPQTEHRFARADVADLQPSAISPMPPGYDAQLTRQELSDLVAFLKSCR